MANLLGDLDRHREWDPKLHQCSLVAQLPGEGSAESSGESSGEGSAVGGGAGEAAAGESARAQVAHLVYKSFSSPYKYRDFVLLQTATR